MRNEHFLSDWQNWPHPLFWTRPNFHSQAPWPHQSCLDSRTCAFEQLFYYSSWIHLRWRKHIQARKPKKHFSSASNTAFAHGLSSNIITPTLSMFLRCAACNSYAFKALFGTLPSCQAKVRHTAAFTDAPVLSHLDSSLPYALKDLSTSKHQPKHSSQP